MTDCYNHTTQQRDFPKTHPPKHNKLIKKTKQQVPLGLHMTVLQNSVLFPPLINESRNKSGTKIQQQELLLHLT
jgi:hypothetical protein